MISRTANYRALAAAAGILACACGGSDQPVPLIWVSQGGITSPAALLSNTFVVAASVDGGSSARVILDTGAPFSLLQTPAFGGSVPDGIGFVGSLTIGEETGPGGRITLLHVPTIGAPGSGTVDGKPFGGLVGFTAFGQFNFSLNYRDQQVSLGSAQPPRNLMPDTVIVPFALEGGGVAPLSVGGPFLEFPASRVIVAADIEGERHNLLVDSGASVVGLRKSVFDRLGADGRGTVDEQFQLASGQSTSQVMRLRSVTVGGVEITDPPCASGSGIETLMGSLSEEVGHTIDGMLGGTVLREFFVTFGYPDGQLVLRRYADRNHIHDEYRRVGIAIAVSQRTDTPPFSYVIRSIYPNTDADGQLSAAGLSAGDDVTAVDGTALPPNDPVAADSMLLGNVGDTHDVTFGSVTLSIRVDELLPLP